MHNESLKTISSAIIQASNVQEELNKVSELADFFSAWNLDQLPGFQERGTIELPTASGIAISSTEAALCTTDYLRTARFIKSVHAALHELISRFPDQRLRVLYAGCGPYATLVLPLLPFFLPEQLELVFLDINDYSIRSCRQLVKKIGFEHYNITFATIDATRFENKKKFHLVLTETMFRALTREPQVAITEHLRSQLLTDGIFLPEEIKLDAACTVFIKEPFLKSDPAVTIPPEQVTPFLPQRWPLGCLFSISHETDFNALTNGTFTQIESEYYKIPKEVNNHPDVCIYTQLRIFGTIYLHSSESLITNPYCVASLANMSGYSHFKLIYNYRSVPGWTCQLKK
ncbi:MAG TPA: hypothetical protein VLB84_07040 [Bacteroidia bacterium]|nr:hypothetical protein [Bacteroidia bacterium]